MTNTVLLREGPELEFTEHETRLDDERKIAIWRIAPTSETAHGRSVVIGAGFARGMHNFAPLALYLAANGFEVYRYDCINHVGISDGDIWDFKMDDALRSLECVASWVNERKNTTVGLVATSLTARVAFQLLGARRSDVKYVLTLAGVVHLRATLREVFETDHFDPERPEISPFVTFENKKICGPPFFHDAVANHWLTLGSTVEALSGADIPIVNFLGTNDPWVDLREAQLVFQAPSSGPRHLYEIEHATHQLGGNAAILREIQKRMVREALVLEGLPAPHELSEPDFEDIIAHSIRERRMQRAVTKARRASLSSR